MDKPIIGPEESVLLSNHAIFLTRKRLQEQLYALLSACTVPIQAAMSYRIAHLPEEIVHSTPKISRGENYLSFPWSILDYPRCFSGKDVFAIRTMCWWGNYFSITFQVGGRFAVMFEDSITGNIGKIAAGDIYLNTGNDPWKHHIEHGDMKPLAQFSCHAGEVRSIIRNSGFLKLMKKISLEDWSTLPAESGKFAELMFYLVTGDGLPLQAAK